MLAIGGVFKSLALGTGGRDMQIGARTYQTTALLPSKKRLKSTDRPAGVRFSANSAYLKQAEAAHVQRAPRS